MRLAIELTREAMKGSLDPQPPQQPADLGRALAQKFDLLDRNIDAVVQGINEQNLKLETALRRQRILNIVLAIGIGVIGVIAWLR